MEKLNRQLDLNLGLEEEFWVGNINLLFTAIETKRNPRKNGTGGSMHREGLGHFYE